MERVVKANKPINYAPVVPDSLHYASLRFRCRLLGRQPCKAKHYEPVENGCSL